MGNSSDNVFLKYRKNVFFCFMDTNVHCTRTYTWSKLIKINKKSELKIIQNYAYVAYDNMVTASEEGKQVRTLVKQIYRNSFPAIL